MNFTTEAEALQAIGHVLSAQSDRDVAVAARRTASDILEDDQPWTHLYIEYGARMIRALLTMLQQEHDLNYLDDYTFLLTGLRQRLETAGDAESKRVANLLILEQTPGLLAVFERGYREDPEGYTAPELVSMWSSILNQEGVALCARYMDRMESALHDCMTSETVGSIVAILLISNLSGHRASTIEAMLPLFVQVERAFNAAFTGHNFAERKWGPGPVTKCLAKLSGAPQIQDRIASRETDLLSKVERVISQRKRDWPVEGFDDAYFMDAKGSACTVIANVAARYDVLELRPTIRTTLERLVADPSVTQSVQNAAHAALLQVERSRGLRGLEPGRPIDALLAVDRCDPGRVALAAAPDAAALAASVRAALERKGYGVHAVGRLDAGDVTAVESCGSVVLCSLNAQRVPDNLRQLVRYVIALRRPCVHVVTSSRGFGGWLSALVDRGRPLSDGVHQCTWSAKDDADAVLKHLAQHAAVPPAAGVAGAAAGAGAAAVAAEAVAPAASDGDPPTGTVDAQ